MKMRFCIYCGKELDEGARFCKYCGQPVIRIDNETVTADAREEVRREEPKEEKIPDTEYRGNPTERKTVYEGEIHKCPNCGEIINPFTLVCPTCGYEIRDSGSPNSVRDLAIRLEMISARVPPHAKEKKSFKTNLYDIEETAIFEENKEKDKVSLIKNFPVPNTKEDIIEFMLLATSNMGNEESGEIDDVTKAWRGKLDQVYRKAQIIMGDQPEFKKIEEIYKEDKKIYEKAKKKEFWSIWGIVLGFIIFFILLMFFVVFVGILEKQGII